MKLHTEVTLPSVGLTGFETPLTEEERAIQASVHRFAKDVLRPLGRQLDKMTVEEAIAPGSPYWSVFAEVAKLGLDSSLLAQLPPDVAIRVESMIGEELGWGDAGLGGFHHGRAAFRWRWLPRPATRNSIDLCAGKIGCWMITHPDKGSDVP